MIEELLVGQEISVLAFSDGYTILPLPAAQDHKRIGEGDTGSNTGGMGTYAPAPVATPEILEQIMKECLQPTVDGMRKEGMHINTQKSYNLLSTTARLSVPWDALYRLHAYSFRSQSTRIQRSLWRSRNRKPDTLT